MYKHEGTEDVFMLKCLAKIIVQLIFLTLLYNTNMIFS